jgi:hypothetical protein
MTTRGDLAPLNPKGWTFETVMRASAGGSVAIRDGEIVAPLAEIQGAIELLRWRIAGCVHEFWPTCADEYWPTLRGLICYAGLAGCVADQRRFSVSPFMSCWPCAVP